ncbi:hypothetical protein [Hymenobacter psychrophilus]|uniref:Uncharacterized protein n=1 Tax=Hymenobacter psychrophilus TaxID=651662 RepID=A0A1H3IXI8_9BACT|nr:hypothetical protein [Hymenobacter psychrophilus]SDY32411.1 hypothetical protein SAMN04488069_107195 [Hymenobacter psychrophilus]
MLLLPLPRRYRRPLLLPPGLLALAWLLWLGCVALPQVRGMRVQHVMEITFPPLRPNSIILADHAVEGTSLPYSSPAIIAAFRPWQTLAVTGNLFEDYFALRNVQAVFRHLGADPNYNRGLQVRIGQEASYSSLIQLLDWCNMYDMKRYWVDIRHEPTTLYTFTSKPDPNYKEIPDWVCGVSGGYLPPVLHKPFWVQFDDFITAFWKFGWFAPLLSPDWRNSTLLLLLLGAVSAYRLGRNWWAR